MSKLLESCGDDTGLNQALCGTDSCGSVEEFISAIAKKVRHKLPVFYLSPNISCVGWN